MLTSLFIKDFGKTQIPIGFCFLWLFLYASLSTEAQSNSNDCFLPPALCQPADVCIGENLFCYGDFEVFVPRNPFSSTLPPTYSVDIPACPSIQITPDVALDQIAGNQVLGFSADEIVIIPLSNPVPPGCTININYKYAKTTDNALPYSTTVNFFGTSVSFCDMATLPACPSINCIESVSTSEGISSIPNLILCNATTTPGIDCDCYPLLLDIHIVEWTTITLTPFVNNTTEPINFIQITANDLYTYHVIDDIVITADCNTALALSAEVTPDCNTDGAIDVTVANGSGNFSYNWTPTNLPNQATQSNLPAGDYTVTVTDNTGLLCSSEITVNVPQDPNCSNGICDVFMIAAMCGWQPFDAYQPCDPCSPNVTHLVMLIKDPNGPINYQGEVWRIAFMDGGIDWYYQDSNTGAILIVPGNNGAAMEFPTDPNGPTITVNDIDHAIVDYFWEKTECKVTPTWNCPTPVTTKGQIDFLVKDEGIKAGDTYRIPVTTSQFKRLSSYLFALDIDESYIDFVGLQKGILPGFSTKDYSYDNGILRAEWYDINKMGRTLNSGQVVFYIIVRAREDVDRLSKYMTQIFSDENNIATNNKEDKYHVIFDFVLGKDIKTDIRSASVISSTLISSFVSPNPFTNVTTINFYSYDDQVVTIKLVDPIGKEVLGTKMEVVKGDNSYSVSDPNLIPGLYFYHIYNGQERLTGSMIKL